MQDVTQFAIDAVGVYEPADDWKIAPQLHAKELPAAAGPLIRILERPALRNIMENFTSADAAAVKYQRAYKRWGRLAIFLNAAAIVTGSIALLGQNIGEKLAEFLPNIGFYGQYVALAQFIAVFGALIAAQIVIRLRPYEKWMHARAEAELARIALFEEVAGAHEDAQENELPVLPLKLEYFRRYQLETEIDYYGGRGAEHDRAAAARATRNDLYASVSAFAAAPISFFAVQLLGEDINQALGGYVAGGDQQLLSSPFLSELLFFAGVVAAALMSAAGSFSLLSQNRRNASRYLVTGDNLAYLRDEYLPKARAAAAEGDDAAVLEFVGAVNDLISSEHTEWIALNETSPKPDFETIAASRLPVLHRRGKYGGA